MTLYATGARRAEVAHLKISDIDSNTRMRPPQSGVVQVVDIRSASLRVCRQAYLPLSSSSQEQCRLLIAQPGEATYVVGRCSVADARPSGTETRAILAVLSQAATCDRF